MKKITVAAFLFAAVAAQAQTVDFRKGDCKAVGVYDSWEESPFMTGELSGEVYVEDSTAVLTRSRFGSNMFGVRIDLRDPFRLTKKERYVHVWVKRPVDDSRLMLVTLGKRSDRPSQPDTVEQSWSISMNRPLKDEWTDVIFAVKGFSYADKSRPGIDIHSLVVCPDVTDRSTMAEDFKCHIGGIVINDDPMPRRAK